MLHKVKVASAKGTGKKAINRQDDSHAHTEATLKLWRTSLSSLLGVVAANEHAWGLVFQSYANLQTAVEAIYSKNDKDALDCLQTLQMGRASVNPGAPETAGVVLKDVAQVKHDIREVFARISKAEATHAKRFEAARQHMYRKGAKGKNGKQENARPSKSQKSFDEGANELDTVTTELYNQLEEIDRERLRVTDRAIIAVLYLQNFYYTSNPARTAKNQAQEICLGARAIPRDDSKSWIDLKPPNVGGTSGTTSSSGSSGGIPVPPPTEAAQATPATPVVQATQPITPSSTVQYPYPQQEFTASGGSMGYFQPSMQPALSTSSISSAPPMSTSNGVPSPVQHPGHPSSASSSHLYLPNGHTVSAGSPGQMPPILHVSPGSSGMITPPQPHYSQQQQSVPLPTAAQVSASLQPAQPMMPVQQMAMLSVAPQGATPPFRPVSTGTQGYPYVAHSQSPVNVLPTPQPAAPQQSPGQFATPPQSVTQSSSQTQNDGLAAPRPNTGPSAPQMPPESSATPPQGVAQSPSQSQNIGPATPRPNAEPSAPPKSPDQSTTPVSSVTQSPSQSQNIEPATPPNPHSGTPQQSLGQPASPPQNVPQSPTQSHHWGSTSSSAPPSPGPSFPPGHQAQHSGLPQHPKPTAIHGQYFQSVSLPVHSTAASASPTQESHSYPQAPQGFASPQQPVQSVPLPVHSVAPDASPMQQPHSHSVAPSASPMQQPHSYPQPLQGFAPPLQPVQSVPLPVHPTAPSASPIQRPHPYTQPPQVFAPPQQPALQSFPSGQPALQSFPSGQPALQSFPSGQPALQSFPAVQPALQSFPSGQPAPPPGTSFQQSPQLPQTGYPLQSSGPQNGAQSGYFSVLSGPQIPVPYVQPAQPAQATGSQPATAHGYPNQPIGPTTSGVSGYSTNSFTPVQNPSQPMGHPSQPNAYANGFNPAVQGYARPPVPSATPVPSGHPYIAPNYAPPNQGPMAPQPAQAQYFMQPRPPSM